MFFIIAQKDQIKQTKTNTKKMHTNPTIFQKQLCARRPKTRKKQSKKSQKKIINEKAQELPTNNRKIKDTYNEYNEYNTKKNKYKKKHETVKKNKQTNKKPAPLINNILIYIKIIHYYTLHYSIMSKKIYIKENNIC